MLGRQNFIIYRCETPASPPQTLFKSLLPWSVSFIACESSKKGGFLFESPAESDYIDAGKLRTPLDALTSCAWVKFKKIPGYHVVFSNGNMEFALFEEEQELRIEVNQDSYR